MLAARSPLIMLAASLIHHLMFDHKLIGRVHSLPSTISSHYEIFERHNAVIELLFLPQQSLIAAL